MTFRADLQDRESRAHRHIMGRRRNLVIAVALGIALVGLTLYLAARAYIFADMPSLPDKAAMWDLNLAPTVTLLDASGERLGHRGPEIGQPRSLTELPRHVPDAFLAIEDERFFEHDGVDREAILRAVWTNMRAGERAQGGSTLTQQLVKNLVLTPEKTYRRKLQEAILAARMEQVLSKPEILELYINRSTLGIQVFGVEAASRLYFDKPATELTIPEAALLAAIPKAPSRLDPRANFDGAWARAGLVIDRMQANRLITSKEAQDARNSPPILAAPTNAQLDESLLGFAFDHIMAEAVALIGEDTQDLVITTSLDAQAMRDTHAALSTTLDKYAASKNVSEGAVVVLDNRTGAVVSMIGGTSYTATKFNRATQAQRQPGSAFKPFVYAAALEDGFTPGTVRIDQPLTIDKWKPENYTKRYRGPMTIREALKLSINTIAAQVGAEVGPSRVAALARRFGVTSDLREVYSLALGSSEVNLLEITSAFSVFANDGLLRPPTTVQSITDTSGRRLFTRRDPRPERVYSRDFARQMTSILHDVVDSGTGYAARFGGRELAGKTGTSQDYRDAWFVGYSEARTAGVWMGNDDNSQMKGVTGGLLPVDVWRETMKAVHTGIAVTPLRRPDPSAISPYRESVVSFYTALSDQLESERNTAAGIGGAGGR